ncbi:MAG: GYD domain-containing protein, partial [Betaproteobacteria bacterium]
MAIGISLVNFTDQGIRNIKDSPKRAAAFRELAKKQGVMVKDIYWTTGQYDMVVVAEGDDEAHTARLDSVGKLGIGRTQSKRARDIVGLQ